MAVATGVSQRDQAGRNPPKAGAYFATCVQRCRAEPARESRGGERLQAGPGAERQGVSARGKGREGGLQYGR